MKYKLGDKKELLPCPFCGARVEIDEFSSRSSKHYRIRCVNRECRVKDYELRSPTLEEAIMDWNTRYGVSADERLKCLYGAKIKGLIHTLIGMAKVVESQGESMVDRLNEFEKEITDGERDK